MDIIKGNFLNRDEVKAHYKYFVFIFGLLMVMIYSNHLVNTKIEHVNKLKEETEEYKSRNAYAQSRLIKIRMESELGKEMVQDSLVSLDSHPMKLLIKVSTRKPPVQQSLAALRRLNRRSNRCFSPQP